MIYEIPVAGVQVAGFVLIVLVSLGMTALICRVLEKWGLAVWIWNPPLFFLSLWACLGLTLALFYYGS